MKVLALNTYKHRYYVTGSRWLRWYLQCFGEDTSSILIYVNEAEKLSQFHQVPVLKIQVNRESGEQKQQFIEPHSEIKTPF